MIDKGCFSKLNDLFSKVINPSTDPNYLQVAQEFYNQLNKAWGALEKVEIFVDSFGKKQKEENPLYFSTVFLFVFEGLYILYLNSIIFLLVKYGHDIFDTIRSRYAHNAKEIERIDVETKFKFLEDHGFGLLVLRDCQTLRNKIAHNDFKIIKNSSKIIISEKECDVATETIRLFNFSNELTEELCKLINNLPKIEEVKNANWHLVSKEH
jgi:hypothetical protein